MRPWENWTEGWLRHKEFVTNPKHYNYCPPIDFIVRDLDDGLNRIILVVGTPRSGKSRSSLWVQCFFNWCYFARPEYKPHPNNLEPAKDLYWDLDLFIEATKDTQKNSNKFITMEEQGIAQYKMQYGQGDVIGWDKVTQIFGVDNTNIVLNLPYLFDLFKGTRLKGHYLLRAIRKHKERVDVIFCDKWMSVTTEKASYKPIMTWENFPDIKPIYPDFVDWYEKLKLSYNARKKNDILEGIRSKNAPKQLKATDPFARKPLGSVNY